MANCCIAVKEFTELVAPAALVATAESAGHALRLIEERTTVDRTTVVSLSQEQKERE